MVGGSVVGGSVVGGSVVGGSVVVVVGGSVVVVVGGSVVVVVVVGGSVVVVVLVGGPVLVVLVGAGLRDGWREVVARDVVVVEKIEVQVGCDDEVPGAIGGVGAAGTVDVVVPDDAVDEVWPCDVPEVDADKAAPWADGVPRDPPRPAHRASGTATARAAPAPAMTGIRITIPGFAGRCLPTYVIVRSLLGSALNGWSPQARYRRGGVTSL